MGGAAARAQRGDLVDDGLRIRPWRSGDGPAVDSLLDPSADALWTRQFHALHGPDGDALSWRRCRVATDPTGTVIGAATVVVNPLHGGRMPCAIEVAPPWRRRGVGSTLLAQVRALRPNASRPLATKLPAGDTAHAFVTRAGGRVYQRCPGIVVDASDPRVRRWAAAQPMTTCTDLTDLDTEVVAAAFADLYAWSHHDWSPVTDTDELMAQSRQDAVELDRALSVGAWVDGQLAALALAFPGNDGIEVVTETTHPVEPHGRELVAGALATLIEKLAVSGGSHVSIDGHVTDPHLQPVLNHIPQKDAHPIDLLEID